jgi:outer membrane protein
VGFQVMARVPGGYRGLPPWILTAFVGLTAAGQICAEDNEGDAESHASVGPGAYMTPRFPGARETKNILFPFIDAEYANRIYTSGADILGLYGCKTTNTEVGAALEYDPTKRMARDDIRLRSLPDVKETARFKLFGSKTVGAITTDVNIARDIAGRGQGTVAQANLWLTVPFAPTFSISAGPGLTWADSRYMHTFFAISAAEAAVSSLPAFASRAGITDVHINGLAEWQIHAKYRLGASIYLTHLQGDAGASPITVQHEQKIIIGWIAYRFN